MYRGFPSNPGEAAATLVTASSSGTDAGGGGGRSRLPNRTYRDRCMHQQLRLAMSRVVQGDGEMAEREQGLWGVPPEKLAESVVRDEPPSPPPARRPGNEWGTASLAMGAVFVLMAPLALLVWGVVISVHA